MHVQCVDFALTFEKFQNIWNSVSWKCVLALRFTCKYCVYSENVCSDLKCIFNSDELCNTISFFFCFSKKKGEEINNEKTLNLLNTVL